MPNINKESLLTQKYVKELFDYKDGFLYWKVSRTAAIKIGILAGTENLDKEGISRRKIGFYPFRPLYASRIIYLWHKGILPEIVDHADRNPENNKIENLRTANKQQNNRNCKSQKGSSSKYLGVSFHKQNGKWTSSIGIDYKKRYIGIYINECDAALAFNREAVRLFGEFASLNIIDPHQQQ